MKLSKFTNCPINKTLEVLLLIHKTMTNQVHGYEFQEVFGGVETTDTSYIAESIDEIRDIRDNLSGSMKSVYIVKMQFSKDGQIMNIELSHSGGSYLKITCSGPSIKDIEILLSAFAADIFKASFYKHNQRAENLSTQKKIQQDVHMILSSTDDLQVRSLGVIQNEKDFQNFLYPILRSHFDDLEDEHYLPKYGVKTYKPDFGIPSGKLLIEAKFIKTKPDLKRIQSELHDDVIGYLGSSDKYKKVIVVIYNFGNVAINSKELTQLEKTRGIASIIVCSHVIPNNLEGKK